MPRCDVQRQPNDIVFFSSAFAAAVLAVASLFAFHASMTAYAGVCVLVAVIFVLLSRTRRTIFFPFRLHFIFNLL